MKKLVFILWVFGTLLNAGQCVQDGIGRVMCSKYQGGDAAKDSIGMVRCGKGQCIVDGIGRVMCSKYQGGGAMIDSIGMVRCQGGCEMGSSNDCETPSMY